MTPAPELNTSFASLVGDSAASDMSLQAQVAALTQQVAQLRQEIDDLYNEKTDLEMLLEMTTEHSDNMEEELYNKVETTLRESEKRFRLIAETMPIPIIVSRRANSEIVYANAPVGPLLGCNSDTVPGRKLSEFFADCAVLNHINALLDQHDQVRNYEVQGKQLDAKPFWVEISGQPLEFNDEPCLLTALYDVTERKRAEEERQKLTANLEKALNEQVMLTTAYSRFVPQEILQFLGKESIVEVHLGDQIQQEMTVLFSDIRSFTSISEHMSPEENFAFLNSYLSRVSPIIREYHGFIDKYIGDAIMALFPGQAFPGQSDHAIHAAVRMQQAVTEYNRCCADYGTPPISIGIGLHTGSVMLGTVGEAERMEGTVISDAVNLASRLEGLTKMYGASIVVSDRTLFSLEHVLQYRFRFLDKVKVKGKREPVSVFEILDGNPEEEIALKLKTQTFFEKGLLHYHSQEFEESVSHFSRVIEVDPDDRAAQLYLKRANHYIEYGVPVDWEGIELLTDK
jgi:adenylate cyclase